ncbi:hypothetical protein BDW74DRAFT_33028 [Aspergillus multicolor]|uniref:uncharacterized protein n=1 Tax=Aspergillus multicolor TaxID=41759 RepID=UPI003CCD645D
MTSGSVALTWRCFRLEGASSRTLSLSVSIPEGLSSASVSVPGSVYPDSEYNYTLDSVSLICGIEAFLHLTWR